MAASHNGRVRVLVLTAEEVNRVSIAGLPLPEVETTRRVLLAMIEKLAVDEAAALEQGQRMPSTRALGERRNNGRRR